jgi:hypothetical protein
MIQHHTLLQVPKGYTSGWLRLPLVFMVAVQRQQLRLSSLTIAVLLLITTAVNDTLVLDENTAPAAAACSCLHITHCVSWGQRMRQLIIDSR